MKTDNANCKSDPEEDDCDEWLINGLKDSAYIQRNTSMFLFLDFIYNSCLRLSQL